MPILDKDMTLCISLSARPSNIGTRFHNYLYDELGLPFVYKAFAPADLDQAIAGVRGLGIRGCAVSMPYKERVIPLVDTLDASASAIDSVNTIVNDGGHLTAYNTDYTAVHRLLARHDVPRDLSVLVRGSGGMAKAVVAALRDAGFTDGIVAARNTVTGPALAESYGYRWMADAAGATADLIVNVTPVGMHAPPSDIDRATARPIQFATEGDAAQPAFDEKAIAAASVVFDVVASPSETPLIRAARAAGKPVITGAEVVALQAEEQFVLYTGVRPTADQVRRAAQFSTTDSLA